MPRTADFPALYARLRALIEPYADRLTVTADTPENYSLDAGYSAQYKRTVFFGAVQIKKNYVAYHLIPVYTNPALLDDISAPLRKRMQGKSCFNFTALDDEMLAELAQLTDRGFQSFAAAGLISSPDETKAEASAGG